MCVLCAAGFGCDTRAHAVGFPIRLGYGIDALEMVAANRYRELITITQPKGQ